jgi:hypothetical protein
MVRVQFASFRVEIVFALVFRDIKKWSIEQP